jgi:hypothetical protein
MFLPYENMYIDTSRCIMPTGFIAAHSFLMLFCLELHCLGPEVLQQVRMLGEWRQVSEESLKPLFPKPADWPKDWSHHNCPYPRGAVVQFKGQYYEALSMLNTSAPSCHSFCVRLIDFALADAERTKAMVLAAICLLNTALLPFIMWSNQWSTYSAMLVPIPAHFCYLKSPRYHAFFNPAPLNLSQLQWDLNAQIPQHDGDDGARSLNGQHGFSNNWLEDTGDEGVDNGNLDILPNYEAMQTKLDCPLFMSGVSASTVFFFGAPRHEESMAGDM